MYSRVENHWLNPTLKKTSKDPERERTQGLVLEDWEDPNQTLGGSTTPPAPHTSIALG